MREQNQIDRYRRMTPDEAREALRAAVRLRLRSLRSTPWRKGMSLLDVLKMHGPDRFADELFDQLELSKIELLKGPPCPDHTAGDQPPRLS